MKPLPVYSIALRLAAPMALAAAASLPPSCAWLALGIASTSATMTVRSIAASLQENCLDHWRVCRLASAFHRIAPRHARRIKATAALRVAAAVRACLGLTFEPLMRQYGPHIRTDQTQAARKKRRRRGRRRGRRR